MSKNSQLPTSRLGILLVSPAIFLLLIFFFMPMALTSIFAFTNMSSATGITGGAHVITTNLLRDLKANGLDPKITTALSEVSYEVSEKSLTAAKSTNINSEFLTEIETNYLGKSFTKSSQFQKALKKLPSRPRKIRDLKLAMQPFTRSIMNIRFAKQQDASQAITSLLPDISKETLDLILTSSYTGWSWTSDNFSKLFSSPNTWRIIGNTFFYVITTLCFNVGVGLFLAITMFYLPSQARGIFSAIWLLPRITPVVLYAIMWKWFTWDTGFIDIIAGYFGAPSFNYMKGSVASSWTVIIFVNGFIGASFGMILFSGALRSIPQQQLWASEVDGATRWQQVKSIILPQMRWPILFVTSYQTLSLLTSYLEIWLTTNGGPGNTTTVWALEAFRMALSNYAGNLQYGMGAAMALVLVTVGLILSIIYLRIFKFDELVSKPKIEF